MKVPRSSFNAFTLIELMVVMGIIALLLTISIPTIYRQLHPDSMQKAVNDVMEACSHARAMAILNGVDMELQIQPHEGVITVAQTSGGHAFEDQTFSPDVSGEDWRLPPKQAGGGHASGLAVTLSERIKIVGLGMNGLDYTDDEVAYVQFYKNGVCDGMSMVLESDLGEQRNVWLEVVTSVADFETDGSKFHER